MKILKFILFWAIFPIYGLYLLLNRVMYVISGEEAAKAIIEIEKALRELDDNID